MNGLEFEKFYKKFDLRLDFLDSNNFETKLLYRDKFVCSFYKNPETGERFVRFPGDGGYVYVAKDMTMKLSKDNQHKYLYEINGDGDGVLYHQYKIKDTEAIQKAIYALKHEWKECLTKIRIRKAINDFR